MKKITKSLVLILVSTLYGCSSPSIDVKSKGLSVGGNSVSSNKDIANVKKVALIMGISDYAPGTKNDLDGIELDTTKMRKLFESWGFKVESIYDAQSLKVVDYLDKYAKELKPNDIFAFYYSGHGSFKKDTNGDEADNKDETLVLSDGVTNEHLIDDTLYAKFNAIKAKKLIFLDSCHSGTAFRGINTKVKAKSISPEDVTKTYPVDIKMRGLSIGGSGAKSKEVLEGSDYIVFSAAQDNEESLATPNGSLFTNALYKTFIDKNDLNKPLQGIKGLLTTDVLNYAKETNSPPHHPNISFSDSNIKSKSLEDFINPSRDTTNNKPTPNIVSNSSKKSNLETTLDNMMSSSDFNRMDIDYGGKTIYNDGESVEFTIDTKGTEGFLTIFYVDKTDVTILYPNPYVSTKKINGKYNFPKDLANGKFQLEAYKSCKSCNEEKTVVYALLSNEPIMDKSQIKSKELISFSKNSKESNNITRAIRVKAIPKAQFKPQLGKYQFIVK